jgi:transcription elongation factor Elf1
MAGRQKKTTQKTKVEQNVIVKKECTMCNKNQAVDTSFYATASKLYPDGRLNICKKCIVSMVDPDSVQSVQDTLRQIDKPFIYNVWETALEEGTGNNPFGKYIKTINSLHQYKSATWDDSVFKNEKGNVNTRNFNEIRIDITPELIIKWGSSYSPEEYMMLEEKFRNMKDDYEIETESHVDYLKKICRLSLKIDEALENDDFDGYKKLSDVYDKLNKSAKFTAVQRSASDRAGGMNTFGEFFEYIEKEGFIPKWHTGEPMDIVDQTLDSLKRFTKQLVLGDSNLARLVEESLQKIKMEEEEDSLEPNDEGIDEEYDYEDSDAEDSNAEDDIDF